MLDPAVLRAWSIKGVLAWGILLPVSATTDIVLFFSDNHSTFPGLWTGILLILCLLWILIIPRLKYRFWRYELRERDLYAVRGIWNRVQTVVPLRRIQHLDVRQDLIEDQYGIARLVVHTAGTRSTDLIIPGLPYDEAVQLRDTVREFLEQHMD